MMTDYVYILCNASIGDGKDVHIHLPWITSLLQHRCVSSDDGINLPVNAYL